MRPPTHDYTTRDDYERGATDLLHSFNSWLNSHREFNIGAWDTQLTILWPILAAHRKTRRPPTAREPDSISARIDLAEQVLASGYGSFTAGGAELSNQRAIAHALIAIAERLNSGTPLRINLVGIETALDGMAATYNPGTAQNATDATPSRPDPDSEAP